MSKSSHIHNVYAHNETGDIIHVSQAESGRNGYFCLGCQCILIAKKRNILIHHFAHDAKDVKKIGMCTFSDETYTLHEIGQKYQVLMLNLIL
jgi:competence CoiA-like predicted nuclease